jgi:hypothetical protein
METSMRHYESPSIECVPLDKYISLALYSPPTGPSEVPIFAPTLLDENPGLIETSIL